MLFGLILIHVLGACVWTGGHLYLALGVLPRAFKRRDATILKDTEEMIERVAMPALILQVLTGIELFRRHAGGFERLFDLDYPLAQFAAAKVALLLATILLAIDVHTRGKRLEGMAWLRFMSWHVIAVTVFGVTLVVLGVGYRTGTFFTLG